MRGMVFGFFGLLALQAPALAATPAACDAVARDWRAAGFSSPAKPSQARVLGNAGYQTTGPQYRQMVQAIHRACDPRDQDAAGQAAVAEALLHRSNSAL